MDPLVLFLKECTLPDGKGKVDKVQRKAPRFGCSRSKSCINIPFLDHT